MADKLCPLIARDAGGMHGPCIEHRCRWYIQLLGTHPQTGEQKAEWGCAVEFLPVLLVENAQQVRQHAAAVESARNESRRDTAAVSAAVVQAAELVCERAARPVFTVSERLGLFSRLRLAFKGGE